MKLTRKHLLAAGILAAIFGAIGVAQAAGFLTNGYPPAGGTQYPSTLPLSGYEQAPFDTGYTQGLNPASEAITYAQIAQGNIITLPTALSVTARLSVSQVVAGEKLTVILPGVITVSTNLSMPTAANLIAALPSNPPLTTAYSYLLKFVNTGGAIGGGGQWNLVADSGVTITGNTFISPGFSRAYLVTLPTLTTVGLQDLGNGF